MGYVDIESNILNIILYLNIIRYNTPIPNKKQVVHEIKKSNYYT